MRRVSPCPAVLAALMMLVTAPAGVAGGTDVPALLAAIKSVRREGAGNAEAGRAWKALVRRGPSVLPDLLAAMDDDSPAASNWLRAAVDAVAEKALKEGKPLPRAALEKFVARTDNPAGARALAYEWLARVDPSAPARLLPGMLHDPSPRLRRDAVARAADEAKRLLDKGDRKGATAAYTRAFAGASDQDQVDSLAARLEALGVKVDRGAHLGYVRAWHLAAPFDNTAEKGFGTAYPPEKRVDLSATYKGKGGRPARWVRHTTADPHGLVDLNKALGKQKGAVAYAYAVIVSPRARSVQVRAGSINAVKVFLNGKEVFAREEYHHGRWPDQYVARARLKEGRNELLLKVCQNEQSEAWAQDWNFQVRLCDPAGAAVPWSYPKGPPAKSGAGKEGK
jgi:hypothetical protein